jgi:hypothetical protein
MGQKLYVRVENGHVAERIALDDSIDIKNVFHKSLVDQMVDVTSLKKHPDQGWSYKDKKFEAPDPEALEAKIKELMDLKPQEMKKKEASKSE